MRDLTQPDDVRDLLAAVLEALDIPHPATIGDGEIHDRILAVRVLHARVALESVLERGDNPGWSADYLRARLTEHPPTGYRHYGTPRPVPSLTSSSAGGSYDGCASSSSAGGTGGPAVEVAATADENGGQA